MHPQYLTSFRAAFFLFLILFSAPGFSLQGWMPSLPSFASADSGPLDIAVEFRCAYFHPSSNRVRRIYGDGWADYQLEISKGIQCNWRLWAGVSGFSHKGKSLGIRHHSTRLEMVPIYVGLRYAYPVTNHLNLFVGGGACYSFLNIRDHDRFVHRKTHKQDWGGVVQSGINYRFCNCIEITLFADYFFQKFHVRNIQFSSCSSPCCCCTSCSNDCNRCCEDRCNDCCRGSSSPCNYIKRNDLDLSGYKVGIGIGFAF